MFEYPRKRAAQHPKTVQKTESYRNVITGLFEQAITKTAKAIGTPIPSARAARLKIATAIFEREINSFKELSDTEISALQMYINDGKTAAFRDFKKWLQQEYGE